MSRTGTEPETDDQGNVRTIGQITSYKAEIQSTFKKSRTVN